MLCAALAPNAILCETGHATHCNFHKRFHFRSLQALASSLALVSFFLLLTGMPISVPTCENGRLTLHSDATKSFFPGFVGLSCFRLLAPAIWTSARSFAASHLLLMKSALTATAGLLILLARTTRCTVQATLRASWVAACCCQENCRTGTAGEPILAELLVHPGLHSVLTLLTSDPGCRQGRHGGVEVFNALGFATLAASQSFDVLAA